jgi:hypothetical protein
VVDDMSSAKMIKVTRARVSQIFPLPASGSRGRGAGSPDGRRRTPVRPTPLVRSEPIAAKPFSPQTVVAVSIIGHD